MADRAHQPRPKTHAELIDALAAARQQNAAAQQRLEAEAEAKHKRYLDWLKPKCEFEEAKRKLHDFWIESSSAEARLENEVTAAADPRIHAALRDVGRQRERSGLAFQQFGHQHNGRAIDQLNAALERARDELRALLYEECDDPAAAVRQVLSRIPTLAELEAANA